MTAEGARRRQFNPVRQHHQSRLFLGTFRASPRHEFFCKVQNAAWTCISSGTFWTREISLCSSSDPKGRQAGWFARLSGRDRRNARAQRSLASGGAVCWEIACASAGGKHSSIYPVVKAFVDETPQILGKYKAGHRHALHNAPRIPSEGLVAKQQLIRLERGGAKLRSSCWERQNLMLTCRIHCCLWG